jgi:hypothetical protein
MKAYAAFSKLKISDFEFSEETCLSVISSIH